MRNFWGGKLLVNQQIIQEERVKFFTNVTHELRTPLTLINGPLEDLLKGGSLNKADYWKVEMVHKNAERLLNLVNKILDNGAPMIENKEDKSNIQSEEINRDREKLLTSLGKIDREFIDKINGLILKGLETGESVNIDYLIDGVCISRPTLYRKLKAVTGMSANEYIRMVKINRAKELMLEGRLSLKEIAEATGFNSIGYFRESFKAVMGVTPGDYIKTLKSGLTSESLCS